ncbi:MAG: hypothetical protein RLZZ70_553 [Candidatus Parcubacteria bacterium]|jgi:L-ascorbate metabolism protein UlaG (beta-lactamase superfamily)
MKYVTIGLCCVGAIGLLLYMVSKPAEAPTNSTETTSNSVTDMNTSTKQLPTVHPVDHASFVLDWGDVVEYHDPVGEAAGYTVHGLPDRIILTHSHGDHLDIPLLETIVTDAVVLIAPAEVYAKLPPRIQALTTVVANDASHTIGDTTYTAIPMYNTTEGKTNFHVKGVGNGYVIEKGGVRVYNASDTEDTPEFRGQTDIDIAFVPMNEPFTMSVEQAAAGVLAMQPDIVYPYHYRGREGVSDIARFKSLVEEKNKDISVILGDWYKSAE